MALLVASFLGVTPFVYMSHSVFHTGPLSAANSPLRVLITT